MKLEKPYILFLPSSQGKAQGGDKRSSFKLEALSYEALLQQRKELLTSLLGFIPNLNEHELEHFFKAKREHSQKAKAQLLALSNSLFLPSIERYTGTMFKAIHFKRLSKKAQLHFKNHVLIFSGLLGVTRPCEPIPNYNLKIDSKYKEFSPQTFWKRHLKSFFLELDSKDCLLLDLLPQSYKKVLPKALKNHISLEFCVLKNEKLSSAGHSSKELKGELIQYIVSKEKLF